MKEGLGAAGKGPGDVLSYSDYIPQYLINWGR